LVFLCRFINKSKVLLELSFRSTSFKYNLHQLGRYESARYVFFFLHRLILLSVNIRFWMYIFKWIFDFKISSSNISEWSRLKQLLILLFHSGCKPMFPSILAWAIDPKASYFAKLNPVLSSFPQWNVRFVYQLVFLFPKFHIVFLFKVSSFSWNFLIILVTFFIAPITSLISIFIGFSELRFRVKILLFFSLKIKDCNG
jgi:hypothetical protein